MKDKNDAPAAADAEAGAPATPDAPEAETAPWGEDFDPARAWKTIQAQRQEAKTLKDRLAEFEKVQQEKEDAEKTEVQRLSDRLTKAEQEAKAARTELLRSKAAVKHGLPENLLEFLTGETEEEIDAKATALAEFAGQTRAPAADVPGKPKPRLVPGNVGEPDDAADDFDPLAMAEKIRSRDY